MAAGLHAQLVALPRCQATQRPRRAHAARCAAATPPDGQAGRAGFKLPGLMPSAQAQAPGRAVCVVCAGTGKKPCGQCGGTGTNQEDLFGGRFVKGDACWLCEGAASTMCGCADMTDSF